MKPQFEDTYIVLKGWMRTKLNLKGNKLTAFALVYGFCQDGNNSFDASLAFIRKWLGVSQPTAVNVMAELTDAQYLIKQDNGAGNPFTYNVNWTKINQLKNFTPPSKKTLHPQLKNFTGGSKKTLHNIDTNKHTNKDREDTRAKNEQPKQPNQTQEAPTPDSAPPPSPVDDTPNWIEVAKQMAAYYEGEGKSQWEFMCAGIANPPEPIEVTRQWAGKHSDAPYMLRNWKRQTGKLTNWIKNEAKNNNKPQNGNATETAYKAPSNVRRAKRHNA